MLSQQLDHLSDNTPPGEGSGWSPRRTHNLIETCYEHDYSVETDSKYDGGQLWRLTVCPLCERKGYNPAVFARDGKLCYVCHSNTCSQRTARDLLERIAPGELGSFIISGPAWAEKHKQPLEVLINGLVHRGEVLNFCAGPKMRKSYIVLQAAICIAFGIPLFGFTTKPQRCLIIDNELMGGGHVARLKRVCTALAALHPEANITMEAALQQLDFWSMREDPKDIFEIQRALRTKRDYGIVFIDSLYKTYPDGVDENSNSGMMRVFRCLASIAASQDSAVIITHHMARGNDQYQTKSVTDLGAGAGAQSRSADNHIVMIPGENPKLARVEGVLREFPPFEAFVIRDQFPLWVVDDSTDFEVRTSARPTKLNKDNFLSLLTTEDQATNKFIPLVVKKLGGTQAKAKLVMGELAAEGIVTVTSSRGNKPELVRLNNEDPA